MFEETMTNKEIDLLSRDDFVDNMIFVSEMLSINKKNACYAVNGSWGIGKSFVLKLYEKKLVEIPLSPERTVSKYLLFHYDCWKYDYYDEPLVAIVALLLDSIDKQLNLFDETKRNELKAILKVIGIRVSRKINEKIEEKTGIDPKGIYDIYTDITSETAKMVAENHEFDAFFDFNKVLRRLRDTVESLAKDQTIVFIVDELDRCLPEYTIKVLERIHHVFNGLPNVQVIISIDKSQIDHTIKQIYGSNTNVKKYLAKFIAFELNLPIGSLNEQAEIFFEEYYGKFSNIMNCVSDEELSEFKHMILDGIDIRSRIAIIEKCNLLHEIIKRESRQTDSIVLCIELFCTILKFYNLDIKKAKNNFSIPFLFDASKTCADDSMNITLPGLISIRAKYENKVTMEEALNNDYVETSYMRQLRNGRICILCHDLWGILLACYRTILCFEDDAWHFEGTTDSTIKQFLLEYWRLLETIV